MRGRKRANKLKKKKKEKQNRDDVVRQVLIDVRPHLDRIWDQLSELRKRDPRIYGGEHYFAQLYASTRTRRSLVYDSRFFNLDGTSVPRPREKK